MFWVIISASAALASPSNLELFSVIVAPYTRCENEGKAKLKFESDKWIEVARASYKNPTDTHLKSKADALRNELGEKSQAVKDECGYEEIHRQLRKKLLHLHPKMDESRAFWFARSVFSSLNNLNEHIVQFERGEFPPSPMAPPPPQR